MTSQRVRGSRVGAGLLSLVALAPGLIAFAAPARVAAQDTGDPVRLDTLAVSVGSNLGLASLPRSVEVITADDLAQLPINSVEAALRWAGSVDLLTRSPAQSDLSIRGGTFEQVLVLVDGMRVSDPQTGHFDLDLTLPIEQIERIEILKGAASAAHGADAFGGVVNIVTRSPGAASAGTRGEARIEGGSFDTFTGALSMETATPSGLGFNLGVSRDDSEGHREGADYEMWRLHSRFSAPLAGGEVIADAGWAARDFGAQGFYAIFDSFEETRTARGSVRWNGALGPVQITPRVAYRKHDDTFILFRDDPAAFTNVHDSRQAMADVTGRLQLATGVRLAVGGDWANETVDSNNLGNRDETRFGAFSELGIERGALDIVGGLRFDDRENFDSFWSPSLAVGLQVADGLRLRSSASRAFRTPTWTDRFYSDPANRGDPDLEMETGWSVEAGADVDLPTLGRFAVFGVTVFERYTENLIDFARPAGSGDDVLWVARNVEEADFTGLELDLNGVQAGPVALTFSGYWLTLDTSEDAAFDSKSSLRPLTRQLSLGADLPVGSRAQFGARLMDRDRIGQENGLTLDLRFRVDVRGSQLFIDGLNVTDEEFLDVAGIAEAGAAVRIGIRTRFGG